MWPTLEELTLEKITLEELTKAVHDALTERNLRLGAQGAFYTVPEEQ